MPVIRTLVISPLCVASAAAQRVPNGEPTAAVRDFFQAVAAKNIDRLVELTAPIVDAQKPAVQAYFERISGRPAPSIVAHLQLSNTAVVVFLDKPVGAGPIDLDPAYLVKRDGGWRVLFKLTRFDRPDHTLTEAEKAEFQRLQTWYERQHSELQRLLREKN